MFLQIVSEKTHLFQYNAITGLAKSPASPGIFAQAFHIMTSKHLYVESGFNLWTGPPDSSSHYVCKRRRLAPLCCHVEISSK